MLYGTYRIEVIRRESDLEWTVASAAGKLGLSSEDLVCIFRK